MSKVDLELSQNYSQLLKNHHSIRNHCTGGSCNNGIEGDARSSINAMHFTWFRFQRVYKLLLLILFVLVLWPLFAHNSLLNVSLLMS